LSKICVYPVIGSIWGIPENNPLTDPEHLWVIRYDEKVWRALCNPALEAPMVDFFVYPILRIWREEDRSIAEFCPKCLAIEAESFYPP